MGIRFSLWLAFLLRRENSIGSDLAICIIKMECRWAMSNKAENYLSFNLNSLSIVAAIAIVIEPLIEIPLRIQALEVELYAISYFLMFPLI